MTADSSICNFWSSLTLLLSYILCQGLGVVCNNEGGFGTDDFVVEFLGEVSISIFMHFLAFRE